MARFDIQRSRKLLQGFCFHDLFIQELGWSQPSQTRPDTVDCDGVTYTRDQIAELAGVVVFELTADDGQIPAAKARARVQKEISQHHHENLLVFVDDQRTQSVWYWVKRDGSKRYPRSHYYVRGQTGDLFLSKIAGMFVDMSELDEDGNLPVIEVARRVQASLDVQRVTKKFYNEFNQVQARFMEHISGISDEGDRRWYTSVILNRLMFTYFLQRKGFIDRGDLEYLHTRLTQSQARGPDRYYDEFLNALFFDGFARPTDPGDTETLALLGHVPYLNGGLFLPHPIEDKARYPHIAIPDVAFEDLFDLFGRYSWNLDDTPGGQDDEINPAVLGYIFEKYINQKAFGAYYTRAEITTYLCEQTIHKLILDKVAEANQPLPGHPAPPTFDNIGDLVLNLDAQTCSLLAHEILPKLSLLDPACGSGAFLVAALKTLIPIYQAVMGRIPFLKSAALEQWMDGIKRQHSSLDYYIKKRTITDNLFGVDIMAEAVEIARLRLFLALVASAQTVDDLEPLPNIDFNVLPGNSLIGLLRVDETQYQQRLGEEAYVILVARKNEMVQRYRHAARHEGLKNNAPAITALRDEIQQQRETTNATLNGILLDRFVGLKIKYEQAVWDAARTKPGKSKKRSLTLDDIAALQPFHWGYEFDEVMNARGGFDAIITNPPWEIFKPIDKEFCYEFDPTVKRRGMSIKAFKAKLAELLKEPQVRKKYLEYKSRFPHVSAYFRSAAQYCNQIAIVNGRKVGTDINLYKLFLEQCYNLLSTDGLCGIVIPSGIYMDLGTKQLREMLFSETSITGLFGFENRKAIFEKVHRSFKFVVLTFKKGGTTVEFPVAFMRHEVIELESFPQEGSVYLPVSLVRRMAPDSLTIMEFKKEADIQIAEKMICFPFLGETIEGAWNLRLTNELHMTNDSHLFKATPGKEKLPLYEGKMIWHFAHGLIAPRYWVDEKEVAIKLVSPRLKMIRKLLRKAGGHESFDEKQIEPSYHHYRLGFRSVTGATNERALVVSVIPKFVVAGHSLFVSIPIVDKVIDKKWGQEKSYSGSELLACVSFMSSFVCDWFIRQQILTNMSLFYIYQLPIPRLTESDPAFAPIVERAAKLICTTPEFDDLAQAVGLGDHTHGLTDPVARAQLRAELDGIIAHIYGLTEAEFAHILSAFPLVEDQVKQDALQAYRTFAPDPKVMALVLGGETETVEFKIGACRNPHTGKKDNKMSSKVVKAVAAFMNAEGGTLLIGVSDDGTVTGINAEYPIANPGKPNWDGYALYLADLLNSTLQLDASFQHYTLTRHTIEGQDVCRVVVHPAPAPVYVDKHLFVRTGVQSRKLDGPDLVEYITGRWG